MTRLIGRLWRDVLGIIGSDEDILREAAGCLREDGEEIASTYGMSVTHETRLLRKMGSEHLLHICRLVWAEQLGIAPSLPLIEILSAKAEGAPYPDPLVLWDGLWLPYAVEGGKFAAIVAGQRERRTAQRRRELRRQLESPQRGTLDDLHAVVETLLREQRLDS
jgi:hypothetical protein